MLSRCTCKTVRLENSDLNRTPHVQQRFLLVVCFCDAGRVHMRGCHHLHSLTSLHVSVFCWDALIQCQAESNQHLVQIRLAHDTLKEASCITDASILLKRS